MFVVLFEVQPKRSQWDRYLEVAATLRPELVKVAGFIDNERYESERTEGRLLSLSTWEDEKALIRWRTHALHHRIQERGRFEIFADYHLRVGEVVADSAAASLPQQRFDTTRAGEASAVTVTEVAPRNQPPGDPAASPDLADAEWYGGINTEGKRLLLASWRSDEAAGTWLGRQSPGPRQRQVRIIRDYGLSDRREAPQYYPPVEPAV